MSANTHNPKVQARFVETTWKGLPEDVIKDWKSQYLQAATPGSAGIDLRAIKFSSNEGLIRDKGKASTYMLRPNETIKVHTGLSVWLNDPSLVGFIFPRSGLGSRGLVLGNLTGVIDQDYQGELIVSLWNRTDDVFPITQGERVAQYLILPRVIVDYVMVDDFHETTERGAGGFGSTGTA
jgi:dUTP pyrophosphatase